MTYQTIYIDEVGPAPDQTYFILTLLIVKDTESDVAIQKGIENLQKKHGKKEIKGSKLALTSKRNFFKNIETLNWEIVVVLFANNVFLSHKHKESLIRLVLDNSSFPLIEMIASCRDQTKIVFDEHTSFYKYLTPCDEKKFKLKGDEKDSYEYVNYRVYKRFLKRFGSPDVPVPCISEEKSSQHKGLMAVDIFAYEIHKKYNCDQDEGFHLFKHKVKESIILEKQIS